MGIVLFNPTLWPFVYKFLCGHMFLFLLSIYLGVKEVTW
jgi:hypothetical protein